MPSLEPLTTATFPRNPKSIRSTFLHLNSCYPRAEERNDENLLIVYNEQIAEQFMKEFQRVSKQAHD